MHKDPRRHHPEALKQVLISFHLSSFILHLPLQDLISISFPSFDASGKMFERCFLLVSHSFRLAVTAHQSHLQN